MGKLATILKLGSLTLFVGICVLLLLLSSPKSGWKALSVQTGSMQPALPIGSLVLVHRVPAASLKVGDVITYISPINNKKNITHRIVAIHGPQIIVKGDANRIADRPVASPAIVGKVNYSLPHVGRALGFTHKRSGTFLLLAIGVYLPAILLIISEIRRLSEYYRKQQPYISPQIATRLKNIKRTARQKVTLASKFTVLLVLASALIAWPVHALLSSTAKLTGNTISATVPTNQCTGNSTTITVTGGGTGNNNVNVNNSNNQSANTGNATNSGNTNGGSATSGNASNSNCTNININIH